MQIRGVRMVSTPTRFRSVASFLGLVTASLICLCGAALVAVSYESLARPIFAGAGFFGYLFFFAHALRELALPSVLVEGRPARDGKVQEEPFCRKRREKAGPNRDFRAAA
jgi:hypothetical protein